MSKRCANLLLMLKMLNRKQSILCVTCIVYFTSVIFNILYDEMLQSTWVCGTKIERDKEISVLCIKMFSSYGFLYI